MNYHFTKVMTWFAWATWLIASSTGCNPVHTRRYFQEWQQWARDLELLEIQR